MLGYAVVAATLSNSGLYLWREAPFRCSGWGIQEAHRQLGNLLSQAEDPQNLARYPWILIPGLFIFLAVMSFNFLGDHLRDRLDPVTVEVVFREHIRMRMIVNRVATMIEPRNFSQDRFFSRVVEQAAISLLSLPMVARPSSFTALRNMSRTSFSMLRPCRIARRRNCFFTPLRCCERLTEP